MPTFFNMLKSLFVFVVLIIAGMTESNAADDVIFEAMEVPADVAERMQGKSFSAGCPVKMADLRYLRMSHYDFNGEVKTGEMICHKDIAEALLGVFRKLFEVRYPIERMVLVDEYNGDDEASMRANNTSCFNFRNVAGSSKLSRHAYGKAVDINPLYNPYVRMRANGTLFVQPSTAGKYVKRDKRSNPYMINRADVAYKAFTEAGFKWGGNWRRYKDYQHFAR